MKITTSMFIKCNIENKNIHLTSVLLVALNVQMYKQNMSLRHFVFQVNIVFFYK